MNIPKKLEFRPHLTTGVIARDRDMEMLVLWLNELRDYLQAKEEIDKTWLKEMLIKDKSKPNYEEASKCQCRCHSGAGNFSCVECESKHDMRDLYKQSEEASKGGCRHCGFKYGGALSLHECSANISKELEKLDPPESKGGCNDFNRGFDEGEKFGRISEKMFPEDRVDRITNRELAKPNPPEHEDEFEDFNELLDSLGYIPVNPKQTMEEHEESKRKVLQDYIRENFVSKEKIKKILNEARFKGDSGYCGKCSHIVRKLESLGLGD